MEKIDLIVPTTATRFRVWFSRHWENHKGIDYTVNPTTHAYLVLQNPQVYPNFEYSYTFHISHTISYVKEGEDISTSYIFDGDTIKISAIELDNERVELEFISTHRIVWEEVVLPFIEEIKRTWEIKDIKGDNVSVTGHGEMNRKLSKQEQEIVDLWRANNTANDIGDIVGLSPGRVRNIVTDLRKMLGEETVPYHSSKRKHDTP